MFFYVFTGDTFSTWKTETKLCGSRQRCTTLLSNSTTLTIIRKQFSKWSEKFSRKLTLCDSTPPGKGEKECVILGKDKLLLPLPPTAGILLLSKTVCEIRWPNHSKKRKKEKETEEKEIIYREAK